MFSISYSWMRRLDVWLGKPLAALVGSFTHRSASLYGDRAVTSVPKKILCTQFIGLGSVILSLPMLRSLKEKGVQIAFCSFEGQAEIVKMTGLADEILIIRPTVWELIPSLFKSWRAVRKFKPDVFIDLEPVSHFSALMGRFSGAETRLGFHCGRPLRENLFTHLVAFSSERHRIENIQLFLKRLGLSVQGESEFPAPPSLDRVRNTMPEMPSRKRVVVNINSGDLNHARMWPEAHWVQLCDKLLEDTLVDLVFSGSSDERDRVQSLMANLKDPTRVFNMAGSVTLIELLRLISDAELVVSVESGIMHLAAWMKTPLMALFGPETPKLHAPLSKSAKTLWAGLPCSPCVNVFSERGIRCGDFQCMKAITPDLAYQTCLALKTAGPSKENKPRVA